MKVLCISASNILNIDIEESTSYKICKSIISSLKNKKYDNEIVDLRKHKILPCVGCGKCYVNHRCICDDEFNYIYEKIMHCDFFFIVSPHYAPIPAKLCMLLEKMEQITFLHWVKDNNYKSEVYDIPTGIISHGGGSDWALQSYKKMVNDTIANALDTIQLKLIPYSDDWDTGISIPVMSILNSAHNVFPMQEYNWNELNIKIAEYIGLVVSKVTQL